MNIANIYRSLKRILNESNTALINRGLNEVDALNKIPSEIAKLGEINKLPYLVGKEIVEIGEDDFEGNTIKEYAFYGCEKLIKVVMPDSITNIGNHAFCYCINLTDIYLNSTTPPTLGDTDAIPTTTTVHVPVGSKEAYDNATNWSYHANRIVEDIEVE